MEDSGIVELYWTRSESAISDTMKKYGKYCFAIAYGILSNTEDANESVNDTYLDAWNSMPPHRPAILSTFLGKITRRISIDRWRGSMAGKRGGGEYALALDELEDCVASSSDVEKEVEQRELVKGLNDFLSSLPEQERDVFICRYFFLLSLSEICNRLAIVPAR